MPPIGTCERLTIEPDRVIAETKFSASSPFARDVFALYAEGVLRGWSVGFVPVKAVPVRPARDRPATGTCYPEWDLLEYSAVPVPENPQALTLAVRKGLVKDSSALARPGRCLADRGRGSYLANPATRLQPFSRPGAPCLTP